MANEQARPMVKPGTAVVDSPQVNKGFQSAAAMQAAKDKPVEESDEIVDGLVSPEVPAVSPQETAEYSRRVTVRSRVAIPAFRYGNETYSLQAGKPTSIPRYVKLHLEEKGLL